MAGPNRLTRLAEVAARTIERFSMIEAGQKVLVAFSGGADSTALLLVLRDLGFQMHLVHVDHGMRAGSASDGLHCIEMASRFGIDIDVRHARPVPSNEEAARIARYSILHQFAEVAGADVIATGHTRDDQAETVQMRLDRGGFGLGIPPKRGKIVRPIIEVTKGETVAVCEEAGVPFVTDPTNEDLTFTRNRIRQRLRQDPAQTERLIHIGADAYRQTVESSERLEEALRSTIYLGESEASIDRKWISTIPADDQGRLLAGVIRRLGAEPHRSSIRQVGRIIGQTGKQVDLGAGMSAWTDASSLNLGHLPSQAIWPETRLAVPGETSWGRWRIRLNPEASIPKDGSEIMDRDAFGPNLWVRAWRPGDRFRPLGCGEKKVQDFFTDNKVPRFERAGVPIVHDGTEIIWVAGFRIADGVKVTSRTTRLLHATCVDEGIDVAG